jgi:hypothetical protein
MPGREQSNLDVLMFCGLGMVQVARTSARVASLALLGRPPRESRVRYLWRS